MSRISKQCHPLATPQELSFDPIKVPADINHATLFAECFPQMMELVSRMLTVPEHILVDHVDFRLPISKRPHDRSKYIAGCGTMIFHKHVVFYEWKNRVVHVTDSNGFFNLEHNLSFEWSLVSSSEKLRPSRQLDDQFIRNMLRISLHPKQKVFVWVPVQYKPGIWTKVDDDIFVLCPSNRQLIVNYFSPFRVVVNRTFNINVMDSDIKDAMSKLGFRDLKLIGYCGAISIQYFIDYICWRKWESNSDRVSVQQQWFSEYDDGKYIIFPVKTRLVRNAIASRYISFRLVRYIVDQGDVNHLRRLLRHCISSATEHARLLDPKPRMLLLSEEVSEDPFIQHRFISKRNAFWGTVETKWVSDLSANA